MFIKIGQKVSLFLLTFLMLLTTCHSVYAVNDAEIEGDVGQDPRGNIRVSGAVQSNFKYEKTINLKDFSEEYRRTIPQLDFHFTLRSVQEESSYSIGKDYGNGFLIEKGALPSGNSMPFSDVEFRESDLYDPILTSLLDSGGKVPYEVERTVETISTPDGETYEAVSDVYGLANDETRYASRILNYILKYSWGEMHSSDHIQTVISREPTAQETEELMQDKEYLRERNWPSDTVIWRCYHDEAQGSFDDGCQLLMDFVTPDNPEDPYDDNLARYENFRYTNIFDLYANPAVLYSAHSFKKPVISHFEKDAAGLYTSISKPLLTSKQYHKNIELLRNANPISSGTKVYRYLLQEEYDEASMFAENKEVKIVDFITFADEEDRLMIFNSLEEADAFYKDAATKGWKGNYHDDFVPKASFINRRKIKENGTSTPPTVENKTGVSPNPVSPRKVPNTAY